MHLYRTAARKSCIDKGFLNALPSTNSEGYGANYFQFQGEDTIWPPTENTSWLSMPPAHAYD